MRQLKITKQVTNRETASLDKYYKKLEKLTLLPLTKKQNQHKELKPEIKELLKN